MHLKSPVGRKEETPANLPGEELVVHIQSEALHQLQAWLESHVRAKVEMQGLDCFHVEWI